MRTLPLLLFLLLSPVVVFAKATVTVEALNGLLALIDIVSSAYYNAANTDFEWLSPGAISVPISSTYIWIGIMVESSVTSWMLGTETNAARFKAYGTFTTPPETFLTDATVSNAPRGVYVSF